jgi:hypothetical protein
MELIFFFLVMMYQVTPNTVRIQPTHLPNVRFSAAASPKRDKKKNPLYYSHQTGHPVSVIKLIIKMSAKFKQRK